MRKFKHLSSGNIHDFPDNDSFIPYLEASPSWEEVTEVRKAQEDPEAPEEPEGPSAPPTRRKTGAKK